MVGLTKKLDCYTASKKFCRANQIFLLTIWFVQPNNFIGVTNHNRGKNAERALLKGNRKLAYIEHLLMKTTYAPCTEKNRYYKILMANNSLYSKF